MAKSEREKRIKKLLNEGVHVVDSVEKEAICGATKKKTAHGPRDVALPCRICGVRDVTVQVV